MLIITGTQRSGTSAVAKMFIEEGYMKESFWDDEAKGGYEHQGIASFYRNYLGDDTFPFDDFPTVTLSNYSLEDIEDEVVKFSYLLMNPVFVYIWHKFRPAEIYHDKFLILTRAPEAVIASKEAVPDRFSHDSLLLQQTVFQLKDNFAQSRKALTTLGYLTTKLYFEDLFEDSGCGALNRALWELGAVRQFLIRQETFNKVLKPEWRHF